jgi:hypothetical protein
MNIKLVYASIIDEKISSFAQALIEIFNFYFGCVTYGPPCISMKGIQWIHLSNVKYRSMKTSNKNIVIFPHVHFEIFAFYIFIFRTNSGLLSNGVKSYYRKTQEMDWPLSVYVSSNISFRRWWTFFQKLR